MRFGAPVPGPEQPRLRRCDGPPPTVLRSSYLESLAEPQEFFVEHLVSGGEALTFDQGGAPVGYAIVAGDALVEIYVTAGAATRLIELFDAVMATAGADRVVCKSFDTQLLCAATSRPAAVRTRGLLYRQVADPSFRPRDGISFRTGTACDVSALLEVDDGFFRDREEIETYAAAGGLTLLLRADGALIGCGTSIPVIAGRNDIDIGMLVAPAFRRRGHGAHIVSFLKHRAIEAGQRPICGCGVANVASQRTLERAGFVSEHRLLEFVY